MQSAMLAMAGVLGFANLSQAQAVPATQPSNAALEAKVAALEAKVEHLEGQDAERQANIAATIKSVLADADRHSTIFNADTSSLAAGYSPSVGFVIRSPDGNFSLHPGLVLEFRNDTAYREGIRTGSGGETAKTGDDTQNGFEVTRLRLTLDGKVNKDIGYFIQIQDDQGQGFGLLDAFATYRFGDSGFGVKAGQFKDPLWHERNLSEARLLAVDRSFTEALLGGGQTSRIQGVALTYDKDQLRGTLALHDGFASLNTKFFDAGGIATGVGGGAGVTPTDYGVSGRAEYMVIGNRTPDFNPFTEYDQFTALGDKQDILVVGGGFDYSEAGSNDVLFHTVDAQYNTVSGWGLYAAYLGSYRNLNSNKGVPAGNYYDPGFQLQAGYLVTPVIEPFARYDYSYLSGNSVSATTKRSVQEITVGANYYLFNQNAKITVDGTWLPNGSPTDSDALGILQDSGRNEFVLRAQFQLAL